MKRSFSPFLLIPLATVLFMACSKSTPEYIIPDPGGTITATLTNSNNFIIYQGAVSNVYYDAFQSFPYVQLRMGMDYNSYVTEIEASPSRDGVNFLTDYKRDGAEVADIGAVKGLGAVTQKPSNGYTAQDTILEGHGYVIRYKKAFHLNSTGSDYFYSRFYVVCYLKGTTTGGVDGAVILYQGPF